MYGDVDAALGGAVAHHGQSRVGQGHAIVAQVPADQDRCQHGVNCFFDGGIGLARDPGGPHHLGAPGNPALGEHPYGDNLEVLDLPEGGPEGQPQMYWPPSGLNTRDPHPCPSR